MSKPTRETLTQETAVEMSTAYATIIDITSRKIKQKDDDTNLNAAKDFLLTKLLAHTSELLGCYFAVRHEYEPLVGAFASLQRRAAAINRQFMQAPTITEESEVVSQ